MRRELRMHPERAMLVRGGGGAAAIAKAGSVAVQRLLVPELPERGRGGSGWRSALIFVAFCARGFSVRPDRAEGEYADTVDEHDGAGVGPGRVDAGDACLALCAAYPGHAEGRD